MSSGSLELYLAITGFCLLATLFVPWMTSAATTGLPLCYLLSVFVMHWFGALAHSFPWHQTVDGPVVLMGFAECAFGVVSFTVAALLIGPALSRVFSRNSESTSPPGRLPEKYIVSGLLFFGVVAPVLKNVPSIGAVSVSGVYLLVAGLCLAIWRAWTEQKRLKIFFWLSLVCFIPAITVVTMGFVGYGAAAAVLVFGFVFAFYRPRWQVVVALLLFMFLGLSAFSTYFRERNALRESVWGGEGLSARITRFVEVAQGFTFFDIHDEDHLAMIDDRLNQNLLVGAAVDNLQRGVKPFAKGETLLNALIAPIPRIIWPNKPVTAGSGGMVTEYTGQEFAEGTSVGIGQVMEFYINFGRAGVILGMGIIGLLIGTADRIAALYLRDGNWARFTAWFLPTIALLNVGGSLVEVVASSAASMVLMYFVNRVLKLGKKEAAGVEPILPHRAARRSTQPAP